MDNDVTVVDRQLTATVVVTGAEHPVVISPQALYVSVDAQEQPVVVQSSETQVVAVGQQGPAGAAGPIGPAGGSAMTVTAGAALGGHRIVYLDAAEKAQYASNQTASHALITLGMTLGAAVLDDPVAVQRTGEITEPSWSWTLEQPVYLGTNGQLTQTPPASPALFQRVVGFPTATTKLFLALREPVFII